MYYHRTCAIVIVEAYGYGNSLFLSSCSMWRRAKSCTLIIQCCEMLIFINNKMSLSTVSIVNNCGPVSLDFVYLSCTIFFLFFFIDPSGPFILNDIASSHAHAHAHGTHLHKIKNYYGKNTIDHFHMAVFRKVLRFLKRNVTTFRMWFHAYFSCDNNVFQCILI